MKQIVKKLLLIIITFSSIIFSACKSNKSTKNTASVFEENQAQLLHILEKGDLNEQQRYTIINQMTTNYLNLKDYQGAVLFLTDWVEQNPNDMYNSYWLLMTAYAYLSMGAEPVAEYYFDRILQQYQDLLVKGNSIHFMCLQNLIQISKSPAHRIRYFNSLINRFPQNVNTTELYLRLAMEYEKDSQWTQALRAYTVFLEQPDATTIQIPGEPDAYKNARHLIDYNSSDKKWTFETLEGLETAVRKAIRNYDWRSLDKYKAKVNFFSMSWKQDETDTNAQEEFSMRSFMRGNRIRCSDTLDPSSTPTEAYLRTTGWSTYVPVWYLYFRKVNFPLDSDIHGNWEWAGIYMGEKL
ncbi:MAG: tetratricopeptide repeat protein [Treponema sp.]|nr:tetratricopeptide repeat protein [Treponema sp.]